MHVKDYAFMTESDDDLFLLGQIAGGDESALRHLYLKYRLPLRRYFWYQLSHDAAQAEDLLQETFLSVWRAARTLRQSSSVAAWIFQIAHRHVLQVRRHASSRMDGHTFSLELDDDRDASVESPEDAIVMRIDLEHAMRQLSEKHREVLYLICLQGFTIEEGAQILSVPPGTVKSRLSYARQACLHVFAHPHVGEER
jgi:RNA polymerase sigma-70 factor, ECF subfamily